jgi:hypothetical protein
LRLLHGVYNGSSHAGFGFGFAGTGQLSLCTREVTREVRSTTTPNRTKHGPTMNKRPFAGRFAGTGQLFIIWYRATIHYLEIPIVFLPGTHETSCLGRCPAPAIAGTSDSRDRKHRSYIFLLRGILGLRIVPPTSRGVRKCCIFNSRKLGCTREVPERLGFSLVVRMSQ